MSSLDHPKFLWADAWFLTALAGCGGRASVARVIGLADAIQHAVMTREELNGAVGRLERAGYVRWDAAGGMALTDEGRELAAVVGESGGYLGQQRRIEERLGVNGWTAEYDPRRAADGAPERISEDVYAAAVRTYTSGASQP